ncbi:MAG: SDR family oxidoreductase [Hyphomonadaceae bacterium]|nr:SDR family oxidoreductase [Hyphomonadaceae bacterium]
MRTAVISGAASGIGACVREKLEAQDFKVIGIDLEGAEISADLSTKDGRSDAIAQALEMSDGKIDRLVLAAGLGGHIENGQLVARVNYYGCVSLLDGFKDALAKTDGRVVVISSNSAQMRTDPEADIVVSMLDKSEEQTMQYIGDAHGALTYGLSKHAVARAVRRRAAEWGQLGITLNAIAPGMTETPMFRGAADHPQIGLSVKAIPIPKTRVATPDEIAGVIEFMLSDAAEYMQGSIIYVDGGTDAQLRPDAF